MAATVGPPSLSQDLHDGVVKVVRALAVALVCAVGVAGVLGLAALGWRWADDPRGNYASWLAAIATVAAFLAAIIAAFYAAGAFRLESERENRWLEEQRRAQASLVAAWIGSAELPIVGGGGFSPYAEAAMRASNTAEGVYLRNASDVPVTQLQYRLFLGFQPCGTRWYGTFPPAADPIFVPFRDADTTLANDGSQVIGGEYEVGISFRDAAGYIWYRAPNGRLVAGLPPWESVAPGAVVEEQAEGDVGSDV